MQGSFLPRCPLDSPILAAAPSAPALHSYSWTEPQLPVASSETFWELENEVEGKEERVPKKSTAKTKPNKKNNHHHNKKPKLKNKKKSQENQMGKQEKAKRKRKKKKTLNGKKDKKKKKEKCPRIKARLNKTRSEGWVGGGLRLLERKVNPFGGGGAVPTHL